MSAGKRNELDALTIFEHRRDLSPNDVHSEFLGATGERKREKSQKLYLLCDYNESVKRGQAEGGGR